MTFATISPAKYDRTIDYLAEEYYHKYMNGSSWIVMEGASNIAFIYGVSVTQLTHDVKTKFRAIMAERHGK